MVTYEQAEEVKNTLKVIWQIGENFRGIGITKVGDDFAVVINVGKLWTDNLPKVMGGVSVVYQEVGDIAAL